MKLFTGNIMVASKLTDLFYMKAFSGSMATISKLNWIGALMSGIISVFSLIGICLTVFRIMDTLLYLSGRNIFDQISDIKNSTKGPILGLPNLFKETIVSGNRASGVDAIVQFLLGLMPDIKAYSDYSGERSNPNLNDDDSVSQYLLKTAIPNIMMLFFLSIGYSGVLWQMFGTVVDAMAVAAEKVASTNLAYSVNKLLNTDAYYKFGFGDDGTKWGELQNNIANSIYNKVLMNSDNTIDGDNSLVVGQNIGEFFLDGKSLSKDNIAKNCGITKETTTNGETTIEAYPDDEAKNIEYSVIVNSVPGDKVKADENAGWVLNDNGTSGGCYTFAMSAVNPNYKTADDFDGTTEDERQKQADEANKALAGNDIYVHVYIYRKKSAVKTNYFSIKNNNSGEESDGDDTPDGTKGNDW